MISLSAGEKQLLTDADQPVFTSNFFRQTVRTPDFLHAR